MLAPMAGLLVFLLIVFQGQLPVAFSRSGVDVLRRCGPQHFVLCWSWSRLGLERSSLPVLLYGAHLTLSRFTLQCVHRTFGSQLQQPALALTLQQRREVFESARPLAGTPPSPTQAAWSLPGWAPGVYAAHGTDTMHQTTSCSCTSAAQPLCCRLNHREHAISTGAMLCSSYVQQIC